MVRLMSHTRWCLGITRARAKRTRFGREILKEYDEKKGRRLSLAERFERMSRLMAFAQTIRWTPQEKKRREREEAVVSERWRRLREHYLARKRSP